MEISFTLSHAIQKIIITRLIISYSFWRSHLSTFFFYLFLIVVVNLTWRQMFLCKLRFAASYRYIFMMLLKKIIKY